MLDPEGNRYELSLDARGRTEESREPEGGVRRFEYCIDGRPMTSSDNLGNSTSYEYDVIGRRVRVFDPDSGERLVRYDAFDRTRFEKDARGELVTHEWDAIDRLIARNDAFGTSTWEHDDGVGASGRVVRSESSDGIETLYEWDAFGRLSSATRTVDGDAFRFDQTFDSAGRVESRTFPGQSSRPGVRYRYDAGFLAGIDDEAGSLIWEQTEIDAIGNISRESFGNGAITSREHEAGTRRVTRIDTTAAVFDGGVPTLRRIQSRSYEHDLNGNPTLRRDELHGLEEVLRYDDVQRLVSSDATVLPTGTTESLEFRYDSLGNMTWASDVGAIEYDGRRPHAASSFLGEPQLYDANGNHQGDSVRRDVQYNSFDKPTVIKDLIRDSQILVRYDAEQGRAVSEGTGGRHIYFGDFEQRDELEVARIRAHGRTVAEIRTNLETGERETQYLHADDQGSIEAVSDGGANVVARHAYSPFGKRLERDWTFDAVQSELGFTEHEHDDEAGLINMRGRMFDPEMRRFTSPDPFVPVAHSPQAHNRYAYVYNRPASFTDPNGYMPNPVELPNPWVPYPLEDAEELQGPPETPTPDDGPATGSGTPETAAGLGVPSPAPMPGSPTGITLVIVTNDVARRGEWPNASSPAPQREIFRVHARQIRRGATIPVDNFESVQDATDYITSLPAGTRIRNLVFIGHGTGLSGPGSFAIQSFNGGNPVPPGAADRLGAPVGGSDSEAFWNAVGNAAVTSGELKVQFLACWIGRDQSLFPSIASQVESVANNRSGSRVSLVLEGFEDFYAIGISQGANGPETVSLEVDRQPQNAAEAETLQTRVITSGVPGNVGHAPPSVTYP